MTKVDHLLSRICVLVEQGDLEAALATCNLLNADLAAGAGFDPVRLGEAHQRIASVSERVSAMQQDLQKQLKRARKRRSGIAAYQCQA